MTSNPVFRGNLHFIGLPDIFQILRSNNRTGELRISSKYVPKAGFIYFLNGSPINSICGALEGIDSVYSLFGWTEGTFEFREKKVQQKNLINKSGMEIVLDAMRMLDDGVIAWVGPPAHDGTESGESNCDDPHKDLPVIRGPLVNYGYVAGEESYRDGEIIVKEGGYGKWIWTVYEGVVKIKKGNLDIARLGEGCYIGTFKALLFGDYQRSASVVADGDVHLCLLDIVRLQNEYTTLSPDFRNLLLSLDNRLKKTTDRVVEIFNNNHDDKASFEEDMMMFETGLLQKELFVIREGNARIIRQIRNENLFLMTLGRNDVFGHIPFVNCGHETQSAFILASEDLITDKLDIQRLEEEYEKLSNTFKNLIFHVGTCIILTTRLAHQLHQHKSRVEKTATAAIQTNTQLS